MATPNPGATGATRPPFLTTTPRPSPGSTGSATTVPPARWQAILDDLAARGVTAAPELVSAEQVTFNDSSLGCPKPGSSYTQALVDGLRVIVRAEGSTWDYRFGTTDTPKLCQR